MHRAKTLLMLTPQKKNRWRKKCKCVRQLGRKKNMAWHSVWKSLKKYQFNTKAPNRVKYVHRLLIWTYLSMKWKYDMLTIYKHREIAILKKIPHKRKFRYRRSSKSNEWKNPDSSHVLVKRGGLLGNHDTVSLSPCTVRQRPGSNWDFFKGIFRGLIRHEKAFPHCCFLMQHAKMCRHLNWALLL